MIACTMISHGFALLIAPGISSKYAVGIVIVDENDRFYGRWLTMNKSYKKPLLEIVRFDDGVITSSNNYCYCYDGEDDWGQGQNDCGADIAFCTCKVNYIAGTANCVVPKT